MKTLDSNKLKLAGTFGKATGFTGELVLIPEHGAVEGFLDASPEYLFLKLEGLPVPYFVEHLREKNGDLIVKLEGINDEASARKLTHVQVYSETLIEESNSPDWMTLIGYSAHDLEFGPIGIIEEIHEYPLQLIAVCHFNEKEVLFPLNESIIVNIDEKKKIVELDLPEGLLDVYLKEPE